MPQLENPDSSPAQTHSYTKFYYNTTMTASPSLLSLIHQKNKIIE